MASPRMSHVTGFQFLVNLFDTDMKAFIPGEVTLLTNLSSPCTASMFNNRISVDPGPPGGSQQPRAPRNLSKSALEFVSRSTFCMLVLPLVMYIDVARDAKACFICPNLRDN